MDLDKWLNSVPDVINFHDMTLVCFEIESNYIYLRWGLSKDGCSSYNELRDLQEKMNKNDILFIDQVFFKPHIIEISMSTGLCTVDLEVVHNDYINETMNILARDNVEKYLSLSFKFEKFSTKIYKIVDDSENLKDYMEFEFSEDSVNE